MTIALALVSALLVVALTISDATRRANRREDLLSANPLSLAARNNDSGAHRPAGALLSGLVVLVMAYHLAFPSATDSLKGRFTALALALAASVCAAHLLVQFHQRWIAGSQRTLGERVHGALAVLLITLAVAFLATLIVPRSSSGFARDVYIADLVAMGVMGAFWSWLARVWRQQLDGGRPWTTAGRLIPVARAMSLICAVLGLLAAVAVWVWPAPPG